MDNGADVVHITTDSAAATQTAAKRGKYAIGNDSDMTLYGPKAHLTAPVFNWGIYFVHTMKQIENKRKHEITTGRFNVFEGPITDRDGAVRFASGDSPTDGELLSMNYFVRGVNGNL